MCNISEISRAYVRPWKSMLLQRAGLRLDKNRTEFEEVQIDVR